jgi:hypothetical protein
MRGEEGCSAVGTLGSEGCIFKVFQELQRVRWSGMVRCVYMAIGTLPCVWFVAAFAAGGV